jgi:hypothetical protein
MDYTEQNKSWPQEGRHILGSFDMCEGSVIVYQAYNDAIADYAVENQTFGGPSFSTTRMTWIKPNFLWMMYRCGWAKKDKNQTRVLAITISLECFEELLASSWISSFGASAFTSKTEWEAAKAASEVVCQWDPDHDPHGNKVNRRAIQLGIRPSAVSSVYLPGIRAIEDITPFVEEQHQHLQQCGVDGLMVPVERPYLPTTTAVHNMLGLDTTLPEEKGKGSVQPNATQQAQKEAEAKFLALTPGDQLLEIQAMMHALKAVLDRIASTKAPAANIAAWAEDKSRLQRQTKERMGLLGRHIRVLSGGLSSPGAWTAIKIAGKYLETILQ